MSHKDETFEMMPLGMDVPLGGMRVYFVRRWIGGPETKNHCVLLQFEFTDELGPPETIAVSPPYAIDLPTARLLRDMLVDAVRKIDLQLAKESSESPKH